MMKSNQRKRYVTYWTIKIRIISDVSSITMHVRGQWNYIFLVMKKEKRKNPVTYYVKSTKNIIKKWRLLQTNVYRICHQQPCTERTITGYYSSIREMIADGKLDPHKGMKGNKKWAKLMHKMRVIAQWQWWKQKLQR